MARTRSPKISNYDWISLVPCFGPYDWISLVPCFGPYEDLKATLTRISQKLLGTEPTDQAKRCKEHLAAQMLKQPNSRLSTDERYVCSQASIDQSDEWLGGKPCTMMRLDVRGGTTVKDLSTAATTSNHARMRTICNVIRSLPERCRKSPGTCVAHGHGPQRALPAPSKRTDDNVHQLGVADRADH